ncbi:MAG TPA: bifunctional serine/threonine-protein kinase/formylglycine-generating enzyme family protein [Blastocatellia bacterium]|nr:bifunctional serine/threonine-protein kinase/formylglycine-generating enzyme family protein [Blastocatellia bacterium]HMX27703.1 bifunctional serine/threonine-protein kinase/formylglycine-generating enzyme family protein [Blastocatellia bacterium]HMZ22051.1 bifunctional serine/threonine-protein kinase/formylglycine-generating enzyme family protein [Blastocatellia bacterium]HNG33275.1 bifunctional serine/threonine-protein kinase/formylglycine-generating enzyme family protein [Blastocatellia ba
MDNLIGKIVCGYRIVSEVGEGGMGKVYLAESAFLTEYKQQVAIKTLTGYGASEKQAALLRDLFVREANIQVQFKHPQIVSVIQFAVEGDRHFLILEYMPGYQHKGRRITNVAQMISYETGPIPHKRALKLFVQALDAMDYAHNFKYRWEGEERVGIVHRDIKPANLLLHDPDTVKVSDFGIVKVQQRKTVTQKLTPGTSAYMSPEAILGPAQFGLSELDARSDIYSLGITLYEMLAGRLPFTPDPNTNPDVSLRRKHTTEAPPPPSAFYPAIPKQLDELVLRALAKRPEDRYQSAKEFKKAILALDSALALELGAGSSRPLNSGQAAAPTERLTAAGTDSHVVYQTDSGRLVTSAAGTRGVTVQPTVQAAPPAKSKAIWVVAALALILATAATALVLKNGNSGEARQTNSGKSTPLPPPEGMALIEGGSFMMGRSLTDAEKNFEIGAPGQRIKIFSYDYPAHPVTVKTFYLDKTEVSNAGYAEFVKAAGHTSPDDWKGTEPPPNADQIPVTHVNYQDATAYCSWLTTKRNDGYAYRLPNEEEWEFAARGKDAGKSGAKMNLYPWGETWLDGAANTKEARLEHTRNVNAYPNGATPAGVLNLAGNVFEWTATDFNHYPGSNEENPKEAGFQGTYQVVRGGSFDFTKEYAMTTTRVWAKPDDKGPRLGFRCAAEPKRAVASNNSSEKKRTVERKLKTEVASAWSRLRRGIAGRIE